MDSMLDLFRRQSELAAADAKQEIRACNEVSVRYGLILSEDKINELVKCRAEALKASGRVEFNGGILPKLIYAFCDSPYLEQDSYGSTLAALQDAFYYYKGEAQEQLTDDELIEFMVNVFNGAAQGSVDYLLETSLDSLCRYARRGEDLEDAYEGGDVF